MLKIASERTFTHTVRARVPIDGGWRDETFKATFRVLASEKLGEFDLTKGEGQREFAAAVIVRIDELEDEQGNPIPYSDEVRDQVVSLPYALAALCKAYVDGVSGALSGNSNGPRAHG